jgi:hypothetical protein
MPLHHYLHPLIERWQACGIDVLKPELEASVRVVLGGQAGRVTSDVINLYGLLGGMSECDDELWEMWSLNKISEMRSNFLQIEGTVFSDYSLDAWHYLFRPVTEDVSEVWMYGFDLGPPVRIANTVEAFFKIYLENCKSLFDPPKRPQFYHAKRDA